MDYGSIGFNRAKEILARGRRLYLQRPIRQYKDALNVVKHAGVLYEVLPNTQAAALVFIKIDIASADILRTLSFATGPGRVAKAWLTRLIRSP
ncbi:MAG: hypothetical protein OXR64_07670 [Chloroflexota bacterium]|nr:hypothetical protein [Chloroflexota bacterium]